MTTSRRWNGWVWAAALAGCVGQVEGSDAGAPRDAAMVDVGARDAEARDAAADGSRGVMDGSPLDATTLDDGDVAGDAVTDRDAEMLDADGLGLDATLEEAGLDDGGADDAAFGDAALGDAGSRDAGSRDAGSRDAGSRDAGPRDGGADPTGTWRSRFFPANWRPLSAGGTRDAMGRALPDFSYAGWHRGEGRPPIGAGTPTITIDAAMGDGTRDATSSIQTALDGACTAGGGIVRLPAGTYRVRLPRASAAAALTISCSHVVLRGDGPTRSRIVFDDATRARSKAVLSIGGSGSVRDGTGTTTYRLASDASAESLAVTTMGSAPFAVGDWVVVRNENTAAFRADHRMDDATSGLSGLWPASQFWGLWYPRRVASIAGSVITLDAPLRADLRTRDRARVYAYTGAIEEVGVEALAIGMVENLTTPGRTEPTSEDDYAMTGTTGYEVHASRAIELGAVHDAWLADVDSFAPVGNTRTGSHVLSMGILVEEGASRITLVDCDWARPQYRGGGGNGYLVHLQGHDVLIVDATTDRARHGFIYNHAASGNVILRGRTSNTRYSDDSHRFLAHANLYDQVELDRAWFQSVNRGETSSGAGFTATDHVWWRTHVIANHASADGCAIESAQWDWGYLIGSSAATGARARLCPRSFSNNTWSMLDQGAPTDFVEGEGEGATLWPPSLHGSMLASRCAREGRTCEVW